MYQCQYVYDKTLKWLNKLEEYCPYLFLCGFSLLWSSSFKTKPRAKEKIPSNMVEGVPLSFLTCQEASIFLFLRRTAPAAGTPALSFSYWPKPENWEGFENLLIEEYGGRKTLRFYVWITPMENYWSCLERAPVFTGTSWAGASSLPASGGNPTCLTVRCVLQRTERERRQK